MILKTPLELSTVLMTVPSKNEIFISVDFPGGDVNVSS